VRDVFWLSFAIPSTDRMAFLGGLRFDELFASSQPRAGLQNRDRNHFCAETL
jgi:hypothetical protein